MMKLLLPTLLVGLVWTSVDGFTVRSPQRQATHLHSLKPVFESLAGQAVQTLGLQETDFTDTYNARTWASNTATGTAVWLSEASPKWLTGVSLCTRINNDGTNEQLTINIWYVERYLSIHFPRLS